MSKERITKIIGHSISWHVDTNRVKELDECSIEHIQQSIIDGCYQGELFVSYGKKQNQSSGWWRIINWEDIALQLRNSIVNSTKKNGKELQKEALKRFNDEWKSLCT